MYDNTKVLGSPYLTAKYRDPQGAANNWLCSLIAVFFLLCNMVFNIIEAKSQMN